MTTEQIELQRKILGLLEDALDKINDARGKGVFNYLSIEWQSPFKDGKYIFSRSLGVKDRRARFDVCCYLIFSPSCVTIRTLGKTDVVPIPQGLKFKWAIYFHNKVNKP